MELHAVSGNYREVLARTGFVVSYTQGVSMLPAIRQGKNYVVVERLDDEPRPGDVLLFEQERRGETVYLLHRFLRVEGDRYVMRGDNCVNCERVGRDALLGRMREIHRVGSERVVKVESRRWRFYSALWRVTWPLRRPYLRLRFAAYNLLKRIGLK